MALKKIKVNPDKKNQEFKPFEIEVKDPTMQERCIMNDKVMDTSIDKNFSFWVEIIKENTSFKDDELNLYSLQEIVGMANAIIESANKKKLKK